MVGAAAAVLIALLLSVPWAALGLAFGLTMAVLNLRFLDAGVAKLNTHGRDQQQGAAAGDGHEERDTPRRHHRDLRRACCC